METCRDQLDRDLLRELTIDPRRAVDVAHTAARDPFAELERSDARAGRPASIPGPRAKRPGEGPWRDEITRAVVSSEKRFHLCAEFGSGGAARLEDRRSRRVLGGQSRGEHLFDAIPVVVRGLVEFV